MVRSLLLAASLAPALLGCVVPIGPEWSDPDSNYPPSISFADPAVGAVLSQGYDGGLSGGGAPMAVRVDLADQNTGDVLYVRWIVDYPPYSADTFVALLNTKPGGSSVLRTPEIFAPDCAHVSHAVSSHRLMLAVSDRPFPKDQLSPDLDWPDAVPEGQYRIEAIWPFELTCP
jgi:hypothetical protein